MEDCTSLARRCAHLWLFPGSSKRSKVSVLMDNKTAFFDRLTKSYFHEYSSSLKPRAAIYATYNAISDGGDKHDAYYVDRRQHRPSTSEREGKDYKLGALRYGFGSPMDGAQKHSRMIMEQQA